MLKQALFRGRELIVIVAALGRSSSGPSGKKRKRKRVESRVAYVQPIADGRWVIVTSPGELLWLCMQDVQFVERCNVTRDDHIRVWLVYCSPPQIIQICKAKREAARIQ